MTEIERKKLQAQVSKIANRVKKYGRPSERVRITLDIMITDQAAINYKVIKLFAPSITDAELVTMLFRLGIQDGAEMLKVLAPKNGIQI